MEMAVDWRELPVELLMMVFDHLKLKENEDYVDYGGKRKILNCRLVHPQWQRAMDDILEKRCLDFWKKDKPTHPSNAVNPYSFPKVDFNPKGKNFTGNIIVPQFLQGEMLESCPFPTKSACLTLTTSREGNKMLNSTREDHFLSRYGQHLTSLTIWDPNGKKTLPAETLQKLLRFTPNLKALIIRDVNIALLEENFHKFPLPPLPHLAHIMISNGGLPTYWNSHNWLVESYQQQLISIKSGYQLRFINSPATFPLLTQLQILQPTAGTGWTTKLSRTFSQIDFPSLKILSWGKFRFIDNDAAISQDDNLQEVLRALVRFKNTLVELYFEVDLIGRSETNPIKYGKRRVLDAQNEFTWMQGTDPDLNHTYPFLKTCSIFYPKFEEEPGVVKDFLGMFPNLETLMFNRFVSVEITPTDDHRELVREHLEKELYQKVCPKLKTIEVRMGGIQSHPFITIHLPPSI